MTAVSIMTSGVRMDAVIRKSRTPRSSKILIAREAECLELCQVDGG